MEYFKSATIPSRSLSHPSRYDNSRILAPLSGEPSFRESMERWRIPESPTDQYHRVSAAEVGRLDLISFNYYGTPLLYWVIMYASDIHDPFAIQEGTILRVPAYETLYGYRGLLV